jgi:hypothetical protein
VFRVLGWVWGVVGAVVGVAVGVGGAILGIQNGKRMTRGEESFLKMRRWNAFDLFYIILIAAGFFCLISGLIFAYSKLWDDIYALLLLSSVFLFAGCLNAVIRVRALQTVDLRAGFV